MFQHTLLIAAANTSLREFLAAQLDADGHAVHTADDTSATIAKLAAHAIDLALVADLEHPAAAPALIGAIRCGAHHRIHREQPIITLGAGDELTALRSYEAGSDHHMAHDTGYVVLRAVIAAVVRITLRDSASRHLHVADLHIDTAARSVDVNGATVRLSRIEFDLLAKLASDPTKVFTKDELKRAIGRPDGNDRTLDSHACRLRRRLAESGARLVTNRWGAGYALTDAH